MKIRSKVILSISLTWLTFLAIAGLSAQFYLIEHLSHPIRTIHYYLLAITILGFLFSLFTAKIIYFLVTKRLEKLNRDTSKNKLIRHISTEGDDEISSISSHFNAMIDDIHTSQKNLDHYILERTQELKNMNDQLQQELSEKKSAEKELLNHKEHLVRLAHYDSLTSLPNRVFFNEMLNKAISHANRHNKKLAILFIDLDRFKHINDTLGHDKGDIVLKEITNRFSTTLRAGDILARLGGDEFIILLNDMEHPKFASHVAEKLLQTCANPIKINSHEFFLTASVGICIFPEDGLSLEDLQRNADMAMYKAKHAGGGSYHYYTSEMNAQAHEYIKLENALRKGIDNNEFILCYQPKLNLHDGKITGVEALIRWENPEFGIMSPATFIPLAEETGLIMQIGEWALREACRTNKYWQDQGYLPITISVNISPKQFQHQDLSQLISNVLQETKLNAKYLEIEITETAVMTNPELAAIKLNDMKNLGIQVSIDDFGTGYTSIHHLKQFAISALKIDQRFIRGMSLNQNDFSITGAIIALAHQLGMKVVAEGVETAEQLQFLADFGCDMVQGYFLSRPLPEQKIILQFAKSSIPEGSTA